MYYRPQLNSDDVKEMLEYIEAADPLPPHHPFLPFFILQDQLVQPESVGGEAGQLWVLKDLLCKVIEDELGSDLANSIPQEWIKQHQKDLSKIQEAYFVFYVASLNHHKYRFRRQEIATMLNTRPDMMSRLYEPGYKHLAQLLIGREVQLRRQRRLATLKSRIPYAVERILWGRQEELERIHDALGLHLPILITGASGLGKSHIVAHIAHYYLNKLNHLLWLNLNPALPLLAQLATALNLSAVNAEEIAATLLLEPDTLVVLENIAPAHAHHLAEFAPLQHTALIAISNQPLPEWAGVHIPLEPLADIHLQRIYNDIGRQKNNPQDAITMIQQAQGNPGLLIQAIYHGSAAIEPAYHTLSSDEVKRLLWLLHWSRDNSVSESVLLLFGVSAASIEVAKRYCYPGSTRLLPVHHAQLAQYLPLSQMGFEDWLATWPSYWESQREMLMTLLVWLSNGLTDCLTYASLFTLLQRLAHHVLQVGLAVHWDGLLTHLASKLADESYIGLWVRIQQSHLLCWSGHLSDALQALNNILPQVQRSQWKDLLGLAHIEAARIALYQQDAITVDKAIKLAIQSAQLSDVDRYTASLIHAQALLTHDPAHAIEIIHPWIATYPQAAAVAAQAAIEGRDLAQARLYANQAQANFPQHSTAYGRFLAVLAQLAPSDVGALGYLEQAITILSDQQDIDGLIRAYNNLGVWYRQQSRIEEARAVWEEALNLLLPLQNGPALRVVRTNLAQLPPPMDHLS